MCERIELGIEAIRRLSPHPSRHARYIPGRGRYVQISRAATDEELERHIRGVDLIGGVSADDDGTTTSVGLDLDAHVSDQRPLSAGKRFVEKCNAMDIPVVVHTSKSGKGLHIRTLFKKPISCWMARALFIAIALASGIDQSKANDKVWPPTRGYGVLALPYQSQFAKANMGTMALNTSTFEPLARGEQIEAVTEAMELDQGDVEGLLNFLGIKTEQAAKILSDAPLHCDRGLTVKDGTDTGIQEMILNCLAVRRLHDEAGTIPYDFWFGMMTNFKPYSGGKELFAAFSELDVERWSRRAFEQSWDAIVGKPRYCSNLQTGWTCPARDTCEARSPAGLPFALRRRERSA